MTRRTVKLLLSLPEKLRFVRGLRAWLRLPARPYPIPRAARAAGEPQYSIWQLIKLASAGLTSFSTKPLRIGLIGGTLLCLGALVAALIYAIIALSLTLVLLPQDSPRSSSFSFSQTDWCFSTLASLENYMDKCSWRLKAVHHL